MPYNTQGARLRRASAEGFAWSINAAQEEDEELLKQNWKGIQLSTEKLVLQYKEKKIHRTRTLVPVEKIETAKRECFQNIHGARVVFG